jgi:Zn-ribbon RNA-binding protein
MEINTNLLYEITYKEKKMPSQKVEYCTSCGIRLVEKGNVKFPCPQCGAEIGRCGSCRQQGNVYKCHKCGYTAP